MYSIGNIKGQSDMSHPSLAVANMVCIVFFNGYYDTIFSWLLTSV